MTVVMPDSLEQLRQRLALFPGVGPKMAERLAFYILRAPVSEVDELIRTIEEARRQIIYCSICFAYTEESPCKICRNPARNSKQICVVEHPPDVDAIEKARAFTGRYHVLQGAISPIEGIGPEQLKVKDLLARIPEEGITEVILATNPNIEGEATAMYLARLLKPLGLRVTRIASGLPVGGDLEYADEVTLGRALEGRREVDA